MSQLTVDIVNLDLAGRQHLPDAAKAYANINSKQLNDFAVPADSGYWTDVMDQVQSIIKDADNNLLMAGTILRLVAYSLAETDTEAATKIEDDCGVDSLPTLGKDGGWSDGTSSVDKDGGIK